MKKKTLLILLCWLTFQAFAWDAPSLNSPTNNSTNIYTGINLNWNAVVNSEGYIIEIDTSSNFSSSLFQSISKTYISSSSSNTDTESFFEDLLFGQKYYWRVKAFTTGDTSSWSSRQFTTLDYVSLSSPSNNSTTVYTGVGLNWNSSYYVDFYEVELDTSQSFNSSLYVNHIDTYISTSSSNTDTQEFYDDLLFGQKYYWRVRAINASDTSLWSQREFTTRNDVSLSSPSNNSTTVYTGVDLNWNSSYYVDFYEVELDTSQSFNSSLYVSHTDTYISTSGSNADTREFYEDLLFGQKYYWRVRAINGSDTSLWSQREFTTRNYVALSSPSNNSTTVYTGVDLNWNSSYYVDFYEVELDTSQSFNSSLYVNHTGTYISTSGSNADTREFYDDLLFGQKYYWRVRAINGSDTSLWTQREFTTIDYVALSSPSNNSTTVYTGVDLNWNSSYYVDFYEVELDTSQSFNSSLYLSHTDTYISTFGSNADTREFYEDLLFGQKYYWRVRAINGSDTSLWTQREFTTIDYVALSSPSNNTVNVSTSNANLNWNSSYYVDFYEVQWDTTSLFNSITLQSQMKSYIATSSSNLDTYQNTGPLLVNQTYYWRVRAINANDTSLWVSRVFSTGPSIQSLSAPSLITPLNTSTNISLTPNLSWTSVNGATNYTVEYSLSSSFSNAQQITAPITSSSLNSLIANSTYYWRVKASNSQTNSQWSVVWSFSTKNNCIEPDGPLLQVLTSQVCENETTTINVQSGNLNDATTWSLYESGCGIGFVESNVNGVFNVSPSNNTVYYVKGEGGCITTSNCGTTSVDVNPIYNEAEAISVCRGSDYTFPDGTVANNIQNLINHISNLQSISSCDSNITTEVNVLAVNTSISLHGNVFIASEPNSQYQWINCVDDSNITGETNQSFTAIENGTYAVVVTDDNCTDTSICEVVNSVSIGESEIIKFNIYPNPVKDILYINTTKFNFKSGVVMDLSGRILFSVSQNIKSIDLSMLPKGIYVLQVESEEIKYQERIVKE